MKVTCNTLLEAPIINLIKLYDSLNVKGVCGVLTPNSKHNVENTTISAMSLLSYCNDLEVTGDLASKLQIVDVSLPKGAITYQTIANSSSGLLTVPSHLGTEPIAMATDAVEFSLLIGSTTAESPLTEDDIYTFVTARTSPQQQFTGVPMPLLSKNLIQFKTKSDDGVSTISVTGVERSILDELFGSLKIE